MSAFEDEFQLERTLSFVENLSVTGKLWFAKAILGAVTSDGRVDKEELLFLKQAISFLDDIEEIKKLIEAAKRREIPELTQRKDFSRDVAFKMMMCLCQIVSYDGEISEGEDLFIREIGRKLGFDHGFIEKTILFSTHAMKLSNKLKEMRKEAITTDPVW